jgi:hypothetical protein
MPQLDMRGLAMEFDMLVHELRELFPAHDLTFVRSPQAAIIFPAAHPDVGEARVYEDDEGLTVEIGAVTWSTFRNESPDLPEADANAEVIEQVVVFLQRLFADRVVLWRHEAGGMHGYSLLAPGQDPCAMEPFIEVPGYRIHMGRRFLWSRPLDDGSSK